MRYRLIPALISFVLCSAAFAAPFQPQILRLSAPKYLAYTFEGNILSIPVYASGTNAGVIFLVYTREKGEKIGEMRNGHLGWHYVNKIDTCIYAAPMQSLSMGRNVIYWNGRDSYGAIVPTHEYTYYLWAYDNVGQGARISDSPEIDFRAANNMGMMKETGDDGLPLANPIFYSGFRDTVKGTTVHKWLLGGDPADLNLVESTYYTLAEGWSFAGGVMTFQPDNHNNFFWAYRNRNTNTRYVEKRTWVPNGESQVVTEWGENGHFAFSAGHGDMTGVQTDGGNYLFTGVGYRDISNEAKSDFYIIDLHNGSQEKHYDMSKWWCSMEDMKAGGQLNGGPDAGFVYRSGFLFLSGGDSCMKQMVDPAARSEDDFYKWTNGNGDYTFDKNAESTSPHPWVCVDYSVGPHVSNWTVDANRFSLGSAYDLGAVTWGLLAPDGTGLGYISVAGETAAWKWGALIVDNDSAFAGIYKDPSNNDPSSPGAHPLLFLGQDSINGVIVYLPAVNNTAPAVFSVAQNSPNPFNPATTVNFTLAKAGKTTIDIYNVAGQKVDTLVDATLSAGSHSVVWNATRFSTGVYFYTVKSGAFSLTKKMTILR